MPRVRFSMRGLMIAVAISAVAILMGDSLRRLSNEYREKANRFHSFAVVLTQGYPGPEGRERVIDHYQRMGDKYERAACYPWLPVAADPAEPE